MKHNRKPRGDELHKWLHASWSKYELAKAIQLLVFARPNEASFLARPLSPSPMASGLYDRVPFLSHHISDVWYSSTGAPLNAVILPPQLQTFV